jgi:hemerythrin-like domain-containing protein
MKRDKRLYPLSWGHQHGLAFARQLKVSLKEGSRTIRELIGQVESFWKAELAEHFRDEEQVLFPPVSLQDSACQALVKKALEEHKTLYGYLQVLRTNLLEKEARQVLAEFASLLTNHIRFEERELFPLIEANLNPAEFDRIGGLLGGSRG